MELVKKRAIPNSFWFVRTEGGKYYREFTKKGYIGINWNDFTSLKDIRDLSTRELKKKVKEHYEDEKRPGGAAAQMQTFVSNMQKGDVVLIPNLRSREIAFGLIKSSAYIEHDIGEKECPFKKRRKVSWLKTVPRQKLDPYLYSLINSHRSITNAETCANFINRTLYDFYGTEEETHLIFNVTSEESIRNSELRLLMNCLFDIAESFNQKYPEYNIDVDDIEFKASVNSPGPIEWISKKKNMVFVLLILNFIVGGEFSIGSMTVKTSGLVNQTLDFYKEYHAQQINQEKLAQLKMILENKLPIPAEGMQYLENFEDQEPK